MDTRDHYPGHDGDDEDRGDGGERSHEGEG